MPVDKDAVIERIGEWFDQTAWGPLDGKAEGAIQDLNYSGWDILDLTLGENPNNVMSVASANWSIIKAEYEIAPQYEQEKWEDDHAHQEYRYAREQMDELIERHSLDELFRAVNDNPHDHATREVESFVNDLLEQGADLGITPDVIRQWVVEEFDERLNALGGSYEPETQFDPQRAREIRKEAREEVLREIRQRYSIPGDDLDEVLANFEDRYSGEGGGPTVETVPIHISKNADDTWSLRIEDAEADTRSHRGDIRDAITREINIDAVDVGGDRHIGVLRFEDGELVNIDLSRGRDRYGGEGYQAAPGSISGWTKISESEDRVEFEKPGAVNADIADRTVLTVEYDPDENGWFIEETERTPKEDGDEPIAARDIRGGDSVPSREAAVDVATRYMAENPYDPDQAAATEGVPALREIDEALWNGINGLRYAVDEETFETATAALERGVEAEVVDQIRQTVGRLPVADVREELYEEVVDAESEGHTRTPLNDFLEALPGYFPPSPESADQSGVARRELTPEERAATSRIRTVIEDPGDMNPLEHYDRIVSALDTADASHHIRISQDDLDTITPQKRESLANEVERLREEQEYNNLSPEDFPEVYQQVQYAGRNGNEQTVRKYEDILRGDRENDDTYPQEQLENVREVEHVVEQMAEELWQMYQNRKTGRDRGQSGVGGFSEGQPEPGMSPDDFEEYRESAASSASNTGSRDPYEDESYMSGKSITRFPHIERAFERLAQDIGERRRIESGDWGNYWRLTPQEQKRYYDRTPDEWLRYWVRGGDVTRSQLHNRGFPDDMIPSEEDADWQQNTRERRNQRSDRDEPSDDELTDGERALRDLFDETGSNQNTDDDDDDDDVGSGMGNLFGG